MSDGDSKTYSQKNNTSFFTQRKETFFLQRYISNVSDVLSPIWLRRPIQINNGLEWFILGSRYRFLFNFRLFLVILYITYEVSK
jgi:hypothetical protein